MGATANYNWNIGIKGQNPWFDDVWNPLLVALDTELYKRSKDLYMQNNKIYGSEDSGGDLKLYSTSHATKGKIYFGANSLFNEMVGNWHLFNPNAAKPALVLKTSYGAGESPNLIVIHGDPAVNRPMMMIDRIGAIYNSVGFYCTGNLAMTYDEATGVFEVTNYGLPVGIPPAMYVGISDIYGPTFLAYSQHHADASHFKGYDLSTLTLNFDVQYDGTVITYNKFKSIGGIANQTLLELTNTLVTNGGVDWQFIVGTPGNYEGYLKIGRGSFGNTWDLAITEGGNVVIGSGKELKLPGAAAITSLETGNNAIYFNSGDHLDITSVHDMIFYISFSEKMRMNATGLGIGNNNPGEKLDVSGNINATGVIKIDSVQIVGNRVIDARIDDTVDSGGYGEMYANNIGQVVTILSKDVYVQVPAGLSEGLNSGFTFQNARELKCLVAGVYQIHWSMSMQATAQSTEIEGAVMLNGTAQAKGTAHAEVSIGGINRPETISGSLILSLAVNDLVSLGVANHTDVADVNLQHASLTVIRIDGYVLTDGVIDAIRDAMIAHGLIASGPSPSASPSASPSLSPSM